MIETDQLEVWNLSRGLVARSGAVDVFNVVGRLKVPRSVASFTYRLNRGPETPIFFVAKGSNSGRLRDAGDFSIDTIGLADLEPENLLRLRIVREGGAEHEEQIRFRHRPFEGKEPRFRLDLAGIDAAEQVGQVVEGRWRVSADARGRSCLEIAPEDAGYDRIILFGRKDWTTGYEALTRLTVTRITGHHNVGVIFKWNPQARGDGAFLPETWSTGLGYYCSYGRRAGIRLRFGVEVHVDESGRKHGEYMLAHRPLVSERRVLINHIADRMRLTRRASELRLHQEYRFRVRVHPRQYALTVWEASTPEPAAQLLVNDPVERLDMGAVGILAYNVGVQVHEFEVEPLHVGAPQPKVHAADALV
jgi:hypothetical protein